MGCWKRCSGGLAIVAMVAAVMIGFGLRHPDVALVHYPVPIGLFLYMASSGTFPLIDEEAAVNPKYIARWARDGDVVVNSCGKCGTTWSLNIVHQLRSYKNATLHSEFTDINYVTPWPQIRLALNSTFDEYWQFMETHDDTWWNSSYPYRVWKLHAHAANSTSLDPPSKSNLEGVYMPHVKTVFVVRNPAEQLESMLHFIQQSNPETIAKFNIPNIRPLDYVSAETFAPFAKETNSAGFMYGWLEHLCKPNMLLVHYTDLKKEPEKWVRKIADFIGETDIPEEYWPGIMERVSFKWMKEREDKFLYKLPYYDLPMVKQLVRSGETGTSHKSKLVTPQMAEDYYQELLSIYPESMVNYLYTGGDFADLHKYCNSN